MQSTSSLLGGQAAPRTIEHNGRQYACRPFTQKVKTEVERRLEACRRQALLGQPGSTPTDVAVVLLRGHADDDLAGRFAFGGEAHREWLKTSEGAIGMTSILFGLSAEEAQALLLGRPAEVGHLIQASVLESLPPAVAAQVCEAIAAAELEQDALAEGLDPNV